MSRIIFILCAVVMTLSSCKVKKVKEVGKFEIGKNTFVLNGTPILIKAAEMHYPRIPKPYWEHRIQLAKSLGMNTICLYVFWNYHEQEEGKFDFSGNGDIAEFCRLAQKNGMYVIVRPGPYVCAEWEMGGLPWWLLNKKGIRLRENDPVYLEKVRVFMNKVGEQIADQQIKRGGNIIMVQVENEYGAYGVDKPYIAAVRDIVKGAGFTDVPLFQCDWASNFENNGLEDLVWTVNFGTGSNIENQFKRLKELRPETPLMCSEYWSGWFDHWGDPHETRPAEVMVAGIKEMIEKNISFSLYMTHGGTSFGYWAGANFVPKYVPTITSYDYDAPIGEYGNTTAKYFQLRELLSKHLDEGQTLPEIPKAFPIISIPDIKITEVAPLFDNLPVAKETEDIHSIEYFNLGYGGILYRNVLPEVKEGEMLSITEANDWTQIFIDGKKIATLNSMKGEGTVSLPAIKAGAVMDILVEPMGRVNFGRGIYNYKGITQKVELIAGNNSRRVLKNWKNYLFPSEYSFVKEQKYTAFTTVKSEGAYYKGSFNIENIGDTFLDVSTWGKGMVWVNGHNIGRFWEIGPQQTMYLPGCWLKKGKNEIIVMDMNKPKQVHLAGLDKPIVNKMQGNFAIPHRNVGQELKLKDETPFYTGSFRPGNGIQEVKFGKTQKARYFALEALSSHGGDDYAAIAELEIFGADGKKIPRNNWRIVYADSEESEAANNSAKNILDLQESTFWHTDYSKTKAKYPHHIVIDLWVKDGIEISGFSYLPRAEANKTGMIKDYKIYLKTTSFKY